ncbi:MAG: flagellar hook-basal body protein [Clostridiales bacterium]|nr:flagellar hook-basal body protein [Clostridiales bacterium]
MFEAILIAATGLSGQQRRIDTIADNLANVNTAGFKAARLDFKDALHTAGFGQAATPAPAGNQQKGHGVMTAAITRRFQDGAMMKTDNPLDFAMEGGGFFAVRTAEGELAYSAGGPLYLGGGEEGRFYLTTASGHRLLDREDNPIEVPAGTAQIEVAQNGEIRFSDGRTPAAQAEGEVGEPQAPAPPDAVIGLYAFSNPGGLEAGGSGLFKPTAASGERLQAGEGVRLCQGVLESSNVELSAEFTRLIRAQRAFSLASRALTLADDMEGIANNLRR